MIEKLRSAAGYTMAAAALAVVLVTFIGSNRLSLILVRATGITVSARYTGGEVVKTIDHGTYRTLIHRPVFDGLIGERRDGFIQINWDGAPPWPAVLNETVDHDGDSVVDLMVAFDTATLHATAQKGPSRKGPLVTGIENTYKLDKGFAVRIALRNKPKGSH